VLRKEDNEWVQKCMEYEVGGARSNNNNIQTLPCNNIKDELKHLHVNKLAKKPDMTTL